MRWLIFLLLGASQPLSAGHTQEVQCLARNIYHESRGETELGQRLVAKVTINRVKSKRYPNTICKVVYQPYQFSWTLNPQPIREPKAWQKALLIARQTINNEYKGLDDFKALYFTHKSIYFKNLKVLGVYGNHRFYV